jgi:hypothetical protein
MRCFGSAASPLFEFCPSSTCLLSDFSFTKCFITPIRFPFWVTPRPPTAFTLTLFSALKTIDPVHHKGVKIALGVFVVCKTDNVLCEADLPTLAEMRKRQRRFSQTANTPLDTSSWTKKYKKNTRWKQVPHTPTADIHQSNWDIWKARNWHT